ncbi:VTT domain-containing protein [Massilia sp. W12]|uniref:VTT domain-containing protein n=1 Tax=Massilia sp. W12 TaxID=3126507 RepID=UPI0030CFBA5E
MDFMQLLDMLVHVDKTLKIFVDQYGLLVYALLFAIVFAETGLVVFFFLPGDSLLFVAGAMCATGSMNVWVLMLLLIIAAITGNTSNYYIGRMLGNRVFTHDYRWINRDALQRTHSFFEKHGGKTIIIARFVPIVRTFAPFVAGVSQMTFAKFQFYNFIGAFGWVVSLVGGGYLFGNIPFIKDNLTAIVVVGISAAIVPVMLGAVWKFGQRLLQRGDKQKQENAG